MNVTTAIQKAYSMAKGKALPPALGTTKYNQLLLEADSLQKVWAAEPGVQWNSLYSPVSLGNISAVSSIDLDDSINYLIKSEQDPPYALDTDNKRTNFLLVQPNQLYISTGANAVAQAGRTMVFHESFTTDSQLYGCTMYVPSILYPDDITLGTDEIQVPDPMWLVFMMAAEFVRNDLVRQNQYASLVNYATQSMDKMKQDNQGSYEQVITDWTPLGSTFN